MWVRIIRQIRAFLKKWLWGKPTEAAPQETVRLKAKEVQHAYICIDYKGQLINLRKTELASFNNLSRKKKREMASYFANQVKKGNIKFIEMDGKTICVQNRNYGDRARKSSR